MSVFSPAIVIAAYNRPKSLSRILGSIQNAHYPHKNIPLIISIDKSNDQEVVKVAESFNWNHGEKRIIEHSENLGLRRHILKCGDLTEAYGSIILLEDDLFVSPYFFNYSAQALNFYQDDRKIAGISLYTHLYDETSFMRFCPLKDSADIFFLQIPSSWGQAWTQKQWSTFKNWYLENSAQPITAEDGVPPNVLLWPETSWKKYYFKFSIANDLYFVYPYESLSTNFADIGTHHFDNRTTLQAPLLNYENQFRFIPFNQSRVVYDSHCELTYNSLIQWNHRFEDYPCTLDLYGRKNLSLIKTKYLLTSKKFNRTPILSFGRELKPHEMNLIFNNLGTNFHLIETNQAIAEAEYNMYSGNRNSYYYNIQKFFLLDNDSALAQSDQVAQNQSIIHQYYEYKYYKKLVSFKLFLLLAKIEQLFKKPK